MEMGNFACIKICVLDIIVSLWYYNCNFFEGYIFSLIFKKCELCDNMYGVKISTFTVIIISDIGISRLMTQYFEIESPHLSKSVLYF